MVKLLPFACLLALTTTAFAVDILIFEDCSCEGNVATFEDGSDAVCDSADVNTCCGDNQVAGCSVAARWGADTPQQDGFYDQAYSTQNSDPCGVAVTRVAMNADINEYVCAEGTLEASVQAGQVTDSTSSRVKRQQVRECMKPNAYAFLVNGTVYGMRKDAPNAHILQGFESHEEKRDYAVAYGKLYGTIRRSGS
ncbi:MAG: hypothetical protein M1819_004566 [Sarea resinae]|nr:MAG: hypothetical protein M1819_004566 [Sarea resinae]